MVNMTTKTQKAFSASQSHSSTRQCNRADPIQHQASAASTCSASLFVSACGRRIYVRVHAFDCFVSPPTSNYSLPFYCALSDLHSFLCPQIPFIRISPPFPFVVHQGRSRMYFCDNPHYCRALSLFSERVPISLYNTLNLYFFFLFSDFMIA